MLGSRLEEWDCLGNLSSWWKAVGSHHSCQIEKKSTFQEAKFEYDPFLLRERWVVQPNPCSQGEVWGCSQRVLFITPQPGTGSQRVLFISPQPGRDAPLRQSRTASPLVTRCSHVHLRLDLLSLDSLSPSSWQHEECSAVSGTLKTREVVIWDSSWIRLSES